MIKFIKAALIISAIATSTIGGISCAHKPTEPGTSVDCGTLDGNQLHKDSEGCYYLNSNGGKEYVSSSNCNC